jgi:hypothetical protein
MVLCVLIIDNQQQPNLTSAGAGAGGGGGGTGESSSGQGGNGTTPSKSQSVPLRNEKSGFTSLETLKAAAELFYQKFSRVAPMMVLETGDERGHLLSYVGDPTHVVEDAIKNIEPCDSCKVSFTISNALTIVNKYRIKNGTDNFGNGRLPW